MPEGPEIWRISDELTEALAHQIVTDIYFSFDRLKKFEEELAGQHILDVEPRGKALITRFENGLNIYSHNQLYGKWMVTDNGEKPDTNRKLRIAIYNDTHTARLYSASEIEVLESDDLARHNYLAKLGPDVLHPEIGFEEVFDRYRDEAYQNRKLTTLLLDQGFLSGIGNYLRSEILFEAGVHPGLKLGDCSVEQKEKLARASLELSRRSYETGGITTGPKLVEALKRENSERWNFRHYVYKREENRCHKCGSVIDVLKTGGRKVYFCPECQSN